MSNSLSQLIAQYNSAPAAPTQTLATGVGSNAPTTAPLSVLATALMPRDQLDKSHSEGLRDLAKLERSTTIIADEIEAVSIADIFGTNVSKSSPSPFGKDQFAPEAMAVMDFPQPNATMSAAELTTYHLSHLRHVVASATASREVLAELWRHLKANPDTKDQLLPTDYGAISLALAKITGARTNSLKATKAKANVKATIKSETASVVGNIFDSMSFEL
jgi:hypothetical protein